MNLKVQQDDILFMNVFIIRRKYVYVRLLWEVLLPSKVLEYLIAGGVTKIISVGSCGVLEDIPENRFLIPVSALRDEGTSYHYLPPLPRSRDFKGWYKCD